ncbi:MAG: WD40 repeat domain-containing protein, partial [Candidatus Acidiferrales bacterium]
MKFPRMFACVLALVTSLPCLCALSAGAQAEKEKTQTSFRIYEVDTGWGTYDARFSPNGQLLAVDSYRWEDTSELIEQIQIWDFRNSRLVASKTLARQKMPKVDDAGLKRGFVRYADAGKKIIACACNEGRLFVLDSKTLAELQNIDLGKSGWPQFPSNSADEAANGVMAIAATSEENRVAVLLTWGLAKASELRVYDLASGSLARKWNFPNFDFGGISIDPEGSRVAISLLPFSPGERPLPSRVRNVFIYDVYSGEIASEFNTGYLAAEVRFVGSDTVATVSAEVGLGAHKKDGIRLLDVKTGRLLREILSPPTGVRYHLEVSGNGKTALGYVAKEVNHWWWFDPASVVTEYERFRLWDLATGSVMATSPDLPSMITSHFALSPNGKVVLIYPAAAGGPLVFYELR